MQDLIKLKLPLKKPPKTPKPKNTTKTTKKQGKREQIYCVILLPVCSGFRSLNVSVFRLSTTEDKMWPKHTEQSVQMFCTHFKLLWATVCEGQCTQESDCVLQCNWTSNTWVLDWKRSFDSLNFLFLGCSSEGINAIFFDNVAMKSVNDLLQGILWRRITPNSFMMRDLK